MRKILTVMAMVAALAMASLAPAMAAPGNSARAQATPVELDANDVRIVQFGQFSYLAVDHGLGAEGCDTFAWREAARLGGDSVGGELDGFNTLYLGVAADGGEVSHRGQVSVYYDCGDDVKSIVAQFNGKGEALSVNGVKVS